MNILALIALKIIKQQESVIGPLAWSEASKVPGLTINTHTEAGIVITDGDDKGVVDSLVKQYEQLFGNTAREVCRQAVGALIADLKPDQIPTSLRSA